jgi:hypothetical protein
VNCAATASTPSGGGSPVNGLDHLTAEECDERLERVIQGDVEVDLPDWAVGLYRGGTAPYDPDLDDGVKVNILPLQAAELLPYRRVV